jgi:hypothetical protein
MNTKKIIGCGLLIVIIALAFIACDDGNKDTHTHDAGIWVITQQPTCTETGIEQLQCTVDHFVLDTATIPALGHDWKDAWTTTPPTCTEGSFDTDTCNRNAEHTRTRAGTTAAIGHDWNTETGLCNNNCGALYYELGDTGPGGGKIFYRTATGFTMTDDNSTAHYLEAAPDELATPETVPTTWASTSHASTDITGTATGIGTGRKNTSLILATDADAPVAKACNDYSNGSKTDWFLPSKDELNQLWVNRVSVGNIMGTAAISTYWSSSQYSTTSAWFHNFITGEQFWSVGKTGPIYAVRAVRAF